MSQTWSKVVRLDSLPPNAKEVFEDGLYVDEAGEVYTVKQYTNKQRKTVTTRVIKKQLGTKSNGYKYVIHKGKSYLVHRLVATAFIDNPNNKQFVNHMDGDKSNNHVSNLEWCTRSENELHAHQTKLKSAEHLYRPVIQLDLYDNFVKEHASITEAVNSLGITTKGARSNIVSACKGRVNTAYKFKWKYA